MWLKLSFPKRAVLPRLSPLWLALVLILSVLAALPQAQAITGTIATETWYFNPDEQTVNNYTASSLNETYSENYEEAYRQYASGTVCYFASDVILRFPNETEVTLGSKIAQVLRSTLAEAVTLSASWYFPITIISELNASVIVRVYGKTNTESTWGLFDYQIDGIEVTQTLFTTQLLSYDILNGYWTFDYVITWYPSPIFYQSFLFGSDPAWSRIEDVNLVSIDSTAIQEEYFITGVLAASVIVGAIGLIAVLAIKRRD